MGVSINDMRKRLTDEILNDQVQGSIEDNKDTIKELQIDQLKHGKRKDGKLIGKYKSDAYAKKKHSMNPLPGEGNMDWILTGELKNEIFVDVRPDKFVIDSADPKATDLIEKHGDPFGMSEESNAALIPDLKKSLVQRTRTTLRV